MNNLSEISFLFFGFLFGSIIGGICISPIPKRLRCLLELAYPGRELPPYVQVLPELVGYVERVIYILFWIMNQPLLIGIWLTLKTAIGWDEWKQIDEEKVPGRATYNIFLIGNGLSIVYAFVGYVISTLNPERIAEGLLISVITIISSIAIRLWLGSKIKKLEELEAKK